jgi:FtsH-binding integral membrane protein
MTGMDYGALSASSGYDEGLKRFMIGVYNHMGLGLVVSGLISYVIGMDPVLSKMVWDGPQSWVFLLSPLAVVLVLSFGAHKLSVAATTILFYVYSALMGVSLSTIFMLYQMGSIFQVFLITATMFLGMSLYGYTTKRDLTSIGGFLMMGLIGIIVAGLANLWFQNSALDLAISAIGVLVFVGLTAYDTQKIKEVYDTTEGDDRAKAGVLGALTLYLDFVNLMLNLLRLMGQRK